MKKLLFLLLFFTSLFLKAQNLENLDFEILEDKKAKNWKEMGQGQYEVHYDKNIKQHGETSASIESNGENTNFKALGYNIPVNFGGKKIKLTGYIKTESVSDGWAGLWMRIDPQVAFDNMQSRGIKGTTDWTKYEIELKLSNQAKKVVVGGILAGKGKIWFDNLKITIDGKSLENAPKKEFTKPELDKEFDEGSQISFSNLDENQIVNLNLLGRIWGFLKYYHPQIGAGEYNWDYELFRILPKYQNLKTNSERDALLTNWIEKLGEVKPCKTCKEVDKEAFLKPDLKWIENSNISEKLQTKLRYIQKNRHQGDHYYIGMAPRVGNPIFKNENAYSNMAYPDDGFRLLTLYRYWNMIQYFFPYKHLMDKNWNTTLEEYIPEFIRAKNEFEFELAALKLIGDIKDTHANLWGGNNKIQEQRGEYFAPIHVKFIENKLVVDNYFEDKKSKTTGLKVGDIITHINTTPVMEMVKKMNNFYPASNQPTRLKNISFDILRSTNNKIDITVNRDDKSFNHKLSLFRKKDILGYYRSYKKKKEKDASYKTLNDNIGYVTLQNIKNEDIPKIKESFKNLKGIIVDIRNYPSTFVPFKLGNYLNSNREDFVKFTQGSIEYPGEFKFRKGHKVGLNKKWTYKGRKVVVLVNEISQSQAEYTAMAFKAGDKTTIIGSTTAGADGNVSRILLPGGLSTMISGIGVYYPDGTETQRIGIVPDIDIKPTIKGIKEGRDEVLEKAIEIINNDVP